jgi:putative Holliday junction resolvase
LDLSIFLQKQNIENAAAAVYVGKSRVLGLDYGDKNIGVAISDVDWVIASPLLLLATRGALDALLKLIQEFDIRVVLIGFPIALNGGTEGMQAAKIRVFAEKLQLLVSQNDGEIVICFWDERFSTHAAKRILSEFKASKAKVKRNIDKIAAGFILQGFIDFSRMRNLKNQ